MKKINITPDEIMAQRGFFLSVEGVEGVGKSTVLHFIQSKLEHAKIDYVLTREPGGTAIGERIRQVLLASYPQAMCSETELLLMFAGRAQNIAEIIQPALQRGQWVISDRFADASYAYQGGGRGIAEEYINYLASWVQKNLQPDLTILLDAPVEVGLARLKKRGAKDRIEEEGIAFFRRVRDNYLQRAKKYPERFRIVCADKSLGEVHQQLQIIMDSIIERQFV